MARIKTWTFLEEVARKGHFFPFTTERLKKCKRLVKAGYLRSFELPTGETGYERTSKEYVRNKSDDDNGFDFDAHRRRFQ